MRIAVIGAGGCAREVAWTIRGASNAANLTFAGYIVTDLSRLGSLDSEVLGDVEWLRSNRSQIDALALGIGAPVVRRRVVDRMRAEVPDLVWPSIVHESVHYDHESTLIGEGVVVCAGSVLTVNVRIEPFVMVHYGCTIGHESQLGRFSVINPGANLAGGVDIGAEAMVGSGAVILQYRSVGCGATVGAGAVVTHDIPERETWVGVPARPLKRENGSAP